MNNYLITGFWIRLLSRCIDLSIVIFVSIILTLFFLEDSSTLKFKSPWLFYVYGLIIISLFFLLFIIIPKLFKGKTIGNFITRIQIIKIPIDLKITNKIVQINLKNNFLSWRDILKRETFWSLSWIFCAVLTLTIINHTLIIKFALTNKIDIKFFNLEMFRIGLVSSFASIVVFIQMFFAISVLVKTNNLGVNDLYSLTTVVYQKHRKIFNPNNSNLFEDGNLKPTLVQTYLIELIGLDGNLNEVSNKSFYFKNKLENSTNSFLISDNIKQIGKSKKHFTSFKVIDEKIHNVIQEHRINNEENTS